MWKRVLPYVLAFLIPAFLMFVLMNILNGGLFPFGEHISAIGDTQYQYVPFQAYIKSTIFGEDNLFYSFSKSIGGDFFSIFISYCLSPFNFIYLLFPMEQLYVAFWIVAVMKSGLAGVAMFAFLKSKNYKNSSSASAMIFSTTYALSFYMIGYHYDLPWLDVVALLPLVAMGIDRILRHGKAGVYFASLLIAVFSNYYFGWMACIFAALYFVYRYLLEYKSKAEIKQHLSYFWKFVKASLLAIACLAVILAPAYFAIKDVYRVNSADYYDFFSPIEKLLPFFGNPVFFKSDAFYLGYTAPFSFVGIAIPVLLVLYFARKKISGRERWLSGGLMLIVLAGFFIYPIEYFWHGFSNPIGNPARYTFVFVFLAVLWSYRVFCQFRHKIGLGAAIAVLQIVSIFWYSIASLSIRYAWQKDDPWIVQANYELNLGTVNDVLEKLAVDDQSFYRTEIYPQSDKTDVSFLYGYNGFSVYTSNLTKQLGNFMNNICNSRYNEIQYDTTLTVDALFGIKYVLSINETGDALGVVENDLALPVGFMARGDVAKQDISGLNCIDVQNKIFTALSGVETPIIDAWDGAPRLNNVSAETQGELTSYETIDKSAEGYVLYDLPQSSDDVFYAYMDDLGFHHSANNFSHATYFAIDDEPAFDGENRPVLLTDKYASDNAAKVLAVSLQDSFSTRSKVVYQESKTALREHYEELADEPCELKKISSSHLSCAVEALAAGSLFFTIPNDEGWTVWVDGEVVKPETAFGLFMSIPVGAGRHEVEMKYFPKGLKAGILVSGLAAAGGGILVWRRFGKDVRRTKAAVLVGAGKKPAGRRGKIGKKVGK
jgi:uncharacterized membrane protein YfhO